MSVSRKLATVGLDGRWKASTLALVATNSNVFASGQPFFKPDGSKLFAYDSTTGSPVLKEYSLSSPWDIFSASLSTSKSAGSLNGWLFFSSDGLKYYISDYFSLLEYSLSSAWDLSSTATLENTVSGLTNGFFRDDGSMFFVRDGAAGRYKKYTLSTPWDTTTLSLDQTSTISTDDGEGLWFKADGSKMYSGKGGTGSAIFREYVLTSPWDIGTLSLNVTSSSVDRGSFYIKPDGSRLFKFNRTTDYLQEYSMG